VSFAHGMNALIAGPNDAAKVALFRATAGMWERGTGRIVRPEPEGILFLPERPYVLPGPPRCAATCGTRGCHRGRADDHGAARATPRRRTGRSCHESAPRAIHCRSRAGRRRRVGVEGGRCRGERCGTGRRRSIDGGTTKRIPACSSIEGFRVIAGSRSQRHREQWARERSDRIERLTHFTGTAPLAAMIAAPAELRTNSMNVATVGGGVDFVTRKESRVST
jgi:hypothetical protein